MSVFSYIPLSGSQCGSVYFHFCLHINLPDGSMSVFMQEGKCFVHEGNSYVGSTCMALPQTPNLHKRQTHYPHV